MAGMLNPYPNNFFLLKHSSLFSVFWKLPYDVRRATFHLIFPKLYNQWQSLRRNGDVREDEVSLAPFDKFKCIFIHIPKCAGTSLAIALFGNKGGGHKPILQYQLIYSQVEFNKYFKFAFVRNPWDRVVSAYSFLKSGGATEKDRLWAETHLKSYPDFRSFVRDWLKPGNVYSYHHFIPQYRYLSGVEKTSMDIDFIGRYETLHQDFERICEKLNIATSLDQHNKTEGRQIGYKDYYDSHTKKIVADVYKDDIELFDYSF